MSEHTETRARADPAEVAFRKIFIGGLSYSTDEEKMKKYFKQYGTVQDAVVMKDPVSKRSRGFGFITFVDIASVDNALDNEPHTIDSRKVEAKRAVPRSEISRETTPTPTPKTTPHMSNSNGGANSSNSTSQKSAGSPAVNSASKPAGAAGPSSSQHQQQQHPQPQSYDSSKHNEHRVNLEDYAYNKIFVGGLHYDTRDAEFRSYFEKYGRVISAEVMFNRETHKSRGFGFIVFEVENSAVKVCNVKEHSIDGKVVEVKRAVPRSRLPAGATTGNANHGFMKGPPSSSAQSSHPLGSSGAQRPASQQAPLPPAAQAPAPVSAPLASSKPRSASNVGTPAVPLPTGRKAYSAVAAAGGDSPAAAAPVPTMSAVAASVAPISSPRLGSAPSYAAAVKVGSAVDPAAAVSRELPAPHLGNSSMNLQTLVFGRIGPDIARPSRSYSEPIVKFEGGSSELNKDSLPFDSHTKPGHVSAITKAPSNGSSRSNSIVQAPSFLGGFAADSTAATNSGNSVTGTPVSLGNLPWLSSPPSNPLDPTGAEFGLPLPPASDQQKQSGVSSTESAQSDSVNSTAPTSFSSAAPGPPPGILGNNSLPVNNGPWFNGQPHHQMGLGGEHHQQHQHPHGFHQQQQFHNNQFGGMLFGNPYIPGGPPPPPPGVMSPDMWAAMVSSHQMHEHQQHSLSQQNQHNQQNALPPMPPPGQFMMPPFPFFGPDGNPIGFPGATPQQQQMMFFSAQQQMQASYNQMQQLQYQNQAQAIALAQAQAQMAAMGAQQQQQQQLAAGTAVGGGGSSESPKPPTSFGPPAGLGFPSAPQPLAGASSVAPAVGPGTGKPSENTENDDLFHFNELNLDSPVFDPSQAWVANRR